MTTHTTDTRLPVQIQTSIPVKIVYESSSDVETEELLRDSEAARATLMKFRREGRSAFLSHAEHKMTEQEESPEQYITAEEYPALAEIWDNDADAVYDEK